MSHQEEIIATKEYLDWRELVFSVPPEQVGVVAGSLSEVHGVLFEIGMLDGEIPWVLSISAFASGEASFRPSVGGGVIGLAEQPRAAEAARLIVARASELVGHTQPAAKPKLPSPGSLQFFFLTAGGPRVIGANLDELQEPGHPLVGMLNLFAVIRDAADEMIGDSP